MAVSKPMHTEFGIHHILESCEPTNRSTYSCHCFAFAEKSQSDDKHRGLMLTIVSIAFHRAIFFMAKKDGKKGGFVGY